MAKQPRQPTHKQHLSDLARWMLNSFGYGRLGMMREEYEAELPHGMPKNIRQARIEAINEIIPPKPKLN